MDRINCNSVQADPPASSLFLSARANAAIFGTLQMNLQALGQQQIVIIS